MSDPGGAKARTSSSAQRVSEATLTMAQYKAQKERERLERRARQLMRDQEYRRALGLDVTAGLPKRLGSAGGTRAASYTGLRGTKRLSA